MALIFLLFFALSLASSSSTAVASRALRMSSSTSETRTKMAPFCGGACCNVDDELKLQETFINEVKAHGYRDADFRSELKASICAVCVPAPPPEDDPFPFSNTNTTAAMTTSSALPLRCAGVVAAPSSISTRHDVGTGGGRSTSSTLCTHRTSTQAYDGVVPLQDGSGQLLCWRRNGQIWLGAVDVDPTGSTGFILRVGGELLMDLGTLVSQGGLAGVAVHFSTGRLFVSYYTTIAADGSALLVVDQLSASWKEYKANRPDPTEATTTRVFSMALPDQSDPHSSSGFLLDYYSGQILCRPNIADPFLYLVTGPAQSDGQLQEKILRFSVGDMPSGSGMVTPMDTQVYAAVLGIPRRCAFDADRPQDLYCAIVKDEQELIYLISESDGPSSSAMPPIVSLIVAHQQPTPGTPPSLVGGLLYRAYADDTLTGSYIYMERAKLWQTVASQARNYATITRNIRVTCSAPTMSPCRSGDFVGGVTSFGEDAVKNALLLATDGVYMVVAPSLCGTSDDNNTAVQVRNWVIGVLASLAAALAGYGAYKYKCCSDNKNQTSQDHNNATNVVNINNGEQNIYPAPALIEGKCVLLRFMQCDWWWPWWLCVCVLAGCYSPRARP